MPGAPKVRQGGGSSGGGGPPTAPRTVSTSPHSRLFLFEKIILFERKIETFQSKVEIRLIDN